jgi:uncharacterized protein
VDPRLKSIVELQKVDSEIRKLDEGIAEVPRQIAEIERQLEESRTVLAEYRKRLETQEKLRHNKEVEVEGNKDKKGKYEAQLYKVRTNKEYTSLLNEIDEVTRQNLQLEEEILELMEEIDSLRKDLGLKEVEFKREVKTVDAQRQEKNELRQKLEAERTESLKVRAGIMKKVDPGIAARYERIARVRKNAVMPVVDGACSGCFMVIRAQMLSKLMAGDSVVTCENCSRILYYVAEPKGEEAGE